MVFYLFSFHHCAPTMDTNAPAVSSTVFLDGIGDVVLILNSIGLSWNPVSIVSAWKTNILCFFFFLLLFWSSAVFCVLGCRKLFEYYRLRLMSYKILLFQTLKFLYAVLIFLVKILSKCDDARCYGISFPIYLIISRLLF